MCVSLIEAPDKTSLAAERYCLTTTRISKAKGLRLPWKPESGLKPIKILYRCGSFRSGICCYHECTRNERFVLPRRIASPIAEVAGSRHDAQQFKKRPSFSRERLTHSSFVKWMW